jgi:peptidoglycan/xylan/chitin deacetylase (PgdA/CDA1 family)
MRSDAGEPPARYLPWWILPGLVSAAPVAALAGETAVAHGLLHPACAVFAVSATWVNCAYFGPVVTQFATSRREIWLTIDDGPDPEDTPRLLDLLDAAGARATFFLIGEKALRHRHLVDEIVRRGHALGYHTRSHPAGTFWASGPWRARREIQSALADIGHPTSLIRAPVGMANIFVHRAVRQLDLDIVGWSIRSLDTRASSGVEVAERVGAQLAPGRIVMLHEGHRDRAGRSFHAEILAATLARLSEGGWQAVVPPRSSWLSRGRPLSPPVTASRMPDENC